MAGGDGGRGGRGKDGVLHFGDNLEIVRGRIEDESIDLVCLDPPFNSMRSYNMLFKTKDDTDEAAQIQAFEDVWMWGAESAAQYHGILSAAGSAADVVKGPYNYLGATDMMAYL